MKKRFLGSGSRAVERGRCGEMAEIMLPAQSANLQLEKPAQQRCRTAHQEGLSTGMSDRHPMISMFGHALCRETRMKHRRLGLRGISRRVVLEHTKSVAGLTYLQGCWSRQKDNPISAASLTCRWLRRTSDFRRRVPMRPSHGWLFTTPGT